MAGSGEKKVLFIIAPGNFRDEELFDTLDELKKASVTATIASKTRGEFTGSRGRKAKATLALNEIDVQAFDAVIFVGGQGASAYFEDQEAHFVAQEFAAQGKIVAAICIAPSILANTGLLRARRATCFASEIENLREKGCSYTGNGVEIDGQFITANGPESAKRFGQEITQMLEEENRN